MEVSHGNLLIIKNVCLMPHYLLPKERAFYKKKITQSTRRLKLTAYISTNFKGRQEEVPLLGKYLDFARCEPLHLKNNTVKEMFIKY